MAELVAELVADAAVALVVAVAVAGRRWGRGRGRQHLRQQDFGLLLLSQRERHLDQVADDLVNVAPMETDLGELSRLNFEEGGLRQLCDPACDLSLPTACGPNHQKVLRDHL